LCTRRATVPARSEAHPRNDLDTRQGKRQLLRGPDAGDERQRSGLSGAGRRQLHPGRRRALIAHRLRQKGGLSYTAAANFAASPLDPRGNLLILAIYNPVNVAKVVSGVDEEVARILRDGVTAEELKRAKDGYLKQLEVGRTNDNMLASSLAENLFIGRTMQFDADLEAKIKALTVEDVNAALRKYIHPEQL